MNEEPIKICVYCGAEYSIQADKCADCGGKLVFPQQQQNKPVVPLEENEERILLRQGAVGYLKELEGVLNQNGIRTDIRFHGCAPGT